MAHNQEMSLVLSRDAKPRLKWTPELHQRFVDAVNQLGGADKATPKSLMRMMSINGLTLYHLKSHLQKYRLGRSQQSQDYHHNKHEDNGENQRNHLTNKIQDEAEKPINESLQVARALQIQMEIQQKLHEQIKVQRHLQLRIEAQGKYLQSVLKKAHDTLSGYTARSIEIENTKAQLSQLVSMVDSAYTTSSSFSVLTESNGPTAKDTGEKAYSLESSLTSSESSERKEETQLKNKDDNKRKRDSVLLSRIEMNPTVASELEESTGDGRLRSMDKIDLNCDWVNEFGSGPKVIDLNSNGVELFGSTLGF